MCKNTRQLFTASSHYSGIKCKAQQFMIKYSRLVTCLFIVILFALAALSVVVMAILAEGMAKVTL